MLTLDEAINRGKEELRRCGEVEHLKEALQPVLDCLIETTDRGSIIAESDKTWTYANAIKQTQLIYVNKAKRGRDVYNELKVIKDCLKPVMACRFETDKHVKGSVVLAEGNAFDAVMRVQKAIVENGIEV